MSETGYRVTIVRKDGITHSTDVIGYSAETAMLAIRRSATNDQHTIAIHIFERVGDQWEPWAFDDFTVRAN